MNTTAGTQPQPPESPLDVLVVAAHPDDAEIGVGGTIAACRRRGLEVGIVDLTDGEPTPHGTTELRSKETAAASEALGLSWRHNLGLPNRRLEHTLEAREQLAAVFRLTRPRILLAPYWADAHPDHVAASALTDAARFWAKLTKIDLPGEPFWPPKIWYYWSIHLREHPKPAFVMDVSASIEQKMAAVRCFQSQIITGRPPEFPTVIDDIRDRARYWGWTIGTAYGEPLAAREETGIRGFDTLV